MLNIYIRANKYFANSSIKTHLAKMDGQEASSEILVIKYV